MKAKIFILGLLLCTMGTAAFAQKTKPEVPVSTTVHLTEVPRALYVDNDVAVILTDSKTAEVTVEGDARDVKAVRIKMNEGALSLYAASGQSMAAVKVYVPASQLAKINLLGKTVLRSATTLRNPHLKIVVDGEGIVAVSSVGNVVIEGTDGYDFVKSR